MSKRISALVFFATVMLAAGGRAYAGPTEQCVTTIEVSETVQWVSVLPETQPPTITRMSFDELGGAHGEVEWDPYDGRGLGRELALTAGTWQVSLWSEPQRDSLKFDRNYAWQSKPDQTCPVWAVKTDDQPAGYVVAVQRDGAASDARIRLRGIARKRLGPVITTSGVRVEGVVPTTTDLNRTFSIAEAPDQVARMLLRAVTRTVKRKAVRLATNRLRKIICAERDGVVVLAETCTLFDQLDLRSLSTTARQAVATLSMDLLKLATRKIDIDAELVARSHAAARLAISALRTRPDVSAAEIQGAFLTMASAYIGGEDTPGRCAARLALSLVAHCHAASQCSAGFVREVINHPADYFDVPTGCGPSWHQAAATVERIESTIADGRRVLAAARNLTSEDRLRALARSSVRLLELVACDGKHGRACRAATLVREVAVAAIDGDLQATVRAGMKSVDAALWTDRQRKFATLFFTFLGEAALVAQGSPEEMEAAQARVEQALETVLDDAANRDGRHGEWIWGLGTGLRAMAAKELGHGIRGPISVPLALTLDRTSNWGDRSPGKAKGLHFELGILDAGNYLRLDDDAEAETVTWSDIASLSFGMGYFWGDDTTPFYVGAQAGSSPGVEGDDMTRRWITHVGVEVGLYFPILDFN